MLIDSMEIFVLAPFEVVQVLYDKLACYTFELNFLAITVGGRKFYVRADVRSCAHVLRQLKIEVDFSRRTLLIFCIPISIFVYKFFKNLCLKQ